jgi:nicotinic acid mononucleotide adenylyltransferase
LTTQTAERQELQRVIDTLPDDRVIVTLDFVNNLRDEQPNAETRAAMAELRAGKGEKVTIDQIMAELNAGN